MSGPLGIAGSLAPNVFAYFDSQRQTNSAKHEARMAMSRNIQMQKEFAQHGLRWKIEDARRAGISPLAALGASGAAFAPVSSFSGDSGPSSAEIMSDMGQNISRAISATSTSDEKRLQALRVQSAQLDIEGKAIDNQIRASQLRQLNSGPAFPGSDNFVPGQGDSGGVKINPSERTSHQPGRPAQDQGWITDRAFARTDTGLAPVPSKDVTERIEDKVVPEAMWAFRNNLIPTWEWLSSGKARSGAPAHSQLPDPSRQEWRWNSFRQEWYPHTWDRRR